MFFYHQLICIVDCSVKQNFSVAGVDNAADGTFCPWFTSASNAALGGSPADSADDLFSAFFDNGGTLASDSSFSSPGNGWDKASDIKCR